MKHINFLVLGEVMWQKIEKVISKRQSPSCSLSDISDGEMYRKLCEPGQILYGNNNLTLKFNTDGVALCKSSRTEIWPIYLAINETPAVDRY